jgi:hypothetical protein
MHESYEEETKNLRKIVLASKVVNPFTRALAPPFIGRRRDFSIPKIPSNLRNIPSVNMYMNVFYILWFAGLISYIYESALSSHIKPEPFRQCLWLGFSLVPESSILPPYPKMKSFWTLCLVSQMKSFSPHEGLRGRLCPWPPVRFTPSTINHVASYVLHRLERLTH